MEQLHSVKAIAERFSVSQQCVYSWTSSGKLPAFKVGGTLRISEQAIQDFMATGARVPAGLSAEAREAIAALVKAAPALTPEKISKLRLLLNDTTPAVA